MGWLKRNNQRFSKQKWDGNRMAILTKLWADVPFRGFVPSDAQARRRLRGSCSFNPSQKLTRREAPLFEICAEIFSPASGVLTSSLRRFFGAVGQGVRCCLMFSWWCVWLNVRRLFGFVLGGNRFLQCNDANVEISSLLLLCFMKWTL